jgi:hypothetical protein
MATITFDTHKFIRTLKAAGVPEGQAEAFSEAFRMLKVRLRLLQSEILMMYDVILMTYDVIWTHDLSSLNNV